MLWTFCVSDGLLFVLDVLCYQWIVICFERFVLEMDCYLFWTSDGLLFVLDVLC